MTSSQQFSPRQAAIDLQAPATFGGATTDHLASLLRATSPVRLRILVTPEMAKYWLETTNIKNRPLSEAHWMKLWLDIAEGRWKYNGEPISFGTNGALLNGQHRLTACSEVEQVADILGSEARNLKIASLHMLLRDHESLAEVHRLVEEFLGQNGAAPEGDQPAVEGQ